MKSNIFLLGLLILAGCATNVVGIYNPGSLSSVPSTFHVFSPDEEDSSSPQKQKIDQQFVDIITAGLEARGLNKSSLPDIYVSFMINVHTSEDLNQNNINPYDYRYRYYNYGYYDPNRFNSQSYKEGVFIIDIRNADNKLVWQGSKSFKLSARRSSTEELLVACREIIADFDPARIN